MKWYIQRKDSRYLETVDEFETAKEARAMVLEYQMADTMASYYVSSRPCKDWGACTSKQGPIASDGSIQVTCD